MKKIITAILVAVIAIATLSACKAVSDGNDAAGNNAADNAYNPAVTRQKAHAAAGPKYTVAQENAIRSGQSYLAMTGFSRAGLIRQLSSKAGEGFKKVDAVFAVNHIQVNWNKEAVESAKSYLHMSSFSRAGLIQQLSSKAGEQFTQAQAKFAADHVGL